LLVAVDCESREPVVSHVFCKSVGILLGFREDDDFRSRLVNNLIEDLLEGPGLCIVLNHLNILHHSLDSLEGL